MLPTDFPEEIFPLGSSLRVKGGPVLKVVGRALSVGRTGDAWVAPGQVGALRPAGGEGSKGAAWPSPSLSLEDLPMNARLATLLAVAMACGLATASAFAQDAMAASSSTAMSHEAMQKTPMKHDGMKHGAMKKDAMKHDGMKHDAMKHDAMMKKDAMKGDAMKGDAMKSGG